MLAVVPVVVVVEVVIFVDPSTTASLTCLREFVLWFALPGLVGRPALMLPLQAGTPMAEPWFRPLEGASVNAEALNFKL